jgi:hypothetical protein
MAKPRNRRCKQCCRAIRGQGVFLYETPRGPVEVHPRCLSRYNGTDQPTPPCSCAAHPPVQSSARRRRRAA